MANIKSAEKRIRTSAKRRERNRAVKSKLRKAVRAERKSTSKDSLVATVSLVDRAVTKGVIHRNAAARYKSRLTKASAKK